MHLQWCGLFHIAMVRDFVLLIDCHSMLKMYSFPLNRADWEESILESNSTKALENTSAYLIDDRKTYIFVYTGIMVFGTICYACHSFCFFQMCVRISVNLHDMLYQGITRAKMFFFNNNPSGRILNRFSTDIERVDSDLPQTLVDVLDVSTIPSSESPSKTQFYLIFLLSQCLLAFIAVIVIEAIVNPWLLIPAAIMTLLFYLIRMVYVKLGLSIIRIEAKSKL